MLSVTNLHGQNEPIADYKSPLIEEELFTSTTGNLTLSFTVLNSEHNKYAYNLIEEESILEYLGHEYRIKNLTESPYSKTVKAPHVFYDLVGTRRETINGGTKSLDQAVVWVLDGTGWTFENVDVTEYKLLENFGKNNVIKLLKDICAAFDCEIEILPNKRLRFKHKIGVDDDFQFRYKHNIKTINKKVDTTNLRTIIKGYGGNGLEVTYRSPNADVFGEIEADPVTDERITIPATMMERLKTELKDVPDVSFEIAEVDLGEPKGLGDKVWTIHEPMGIEFQQRIVARKVYPEQKGKNTVTLGTRPKQLSDLLAETNIKIDNNNKQVQSRIDQTNERIELAVEEIDGEIATLELSVGQIQSTVTGAGGLQSQVTQNAREIESRVTYNDFNGDAITSRINQSATTIEIEASRINFIGHAFGENATFTGTIETYQDVRVGNNIYLAENRSGTKAIRFNNTSGIFSEGWNMILSSPNLIADAGMTVQGTLNVTGEITGNANANFYDVQIDYLWLGSSLRYSGGYLTAPSGSLSISQNTVQANTITQLSNAVYKKNIADWEHNATDMIVSTPIKQYQYIAEEDEEFPHVGVIVQDAPVWAVSLNGEGVEPYKMATLAWKAIQELDARMKKLEGEETE